MWKVERVQADSPGFPRLDFRSSMGMKSMIGEAEGTIVIADGYD